jgi:release factor glutamine methyltransferase
LAVPTPSTPARWTILDVIRWTTSRFEERALASPRLDAELLTAHALGLARVQLYVQHDRPLLPAELAALRELVKRRQAGESVAYIVGKKEFFGLEFTVDQRVLVPRPDTETLVDEALAFLRADVSDLAGESTSERPPLLVADVGTGSGAIAVAIAKHAPGVRMVASDRSADALAVATENAARLGIPITFVQGDLLEPLRVLGLFDLIVANLPYIPTATISTLAPEVQAEPALALDGGPDGLALVRRLVAEAPALLRPHGALALEIGAGQASETAALMEAAGFTEIRQRRDLGEIDRVVSGRKKT